MIKTIMPQLSIIVAVDEDGGFGKNGKIPWFFPEDMKHFKEVTTGGVCLMGRNTYEDMYEMVKERNAKKAISEMPKNILPNRQTFVITSREGYKAPGAAAVPSIRDALRALSVDDSREIFICGGLRMYTQGLVWANTVYITKIKNERYQCDRFFPLTTLNKDYTIVDIKKTKNLDFITYKRG